MGMREQEDGKNECRSVTDRIRVQTLPDCESRQTSIWCPFAREFEESFYEGKQMTASCFDDRCALRPIYARRLQVRIAKAVMESLCITAGSSDKEGPLECLSLMMGNLHTRFLGGLELVTAPDYPTNARPSLFFGYTRCWAGNLLKKWMKMTWMPACFGMGSMDNF